jgi:hypothetical protein
MTRIRKRDRLEGFTEQSRNVCKIVRRKLKSFVDPHKVAIGFMSCTTLNTLLNTLYTPRQFISAQNPSRRQY